MNSNPHWMELLLGRHVPLPVGGVFGVPVVLGQLQLSVRDGYMLHINEVADGAYVLLVSPKDATRAVGGAEDGKASNASSSASGGGGGGGGGGSGVGFWVGIADAVSGVVTKLGDWVAGWFPKAQEAKLKRIQMEAKANRVTYNNSPERLAQRDQQAQMAEQIAAIVAALDDDKKPEVSGLPISVRRIEVGRAPRPQIPFGCSVRGGPKRDCPCGCGGACGCGGHK
jgi:hypothetical protein